jgi:hypothetical protein
MTLERVQQSNRGAAVGEGNRQHIRQNVWSGGRPWKKCEICVFWVRKTIYYCGILSLSVRMRAPYAPLMSFGSRAKQAKPEAQSSGSEQPLKTAF